MKSLKTILLYKTLCLIFLTVVLVSCEDDPAEELSLSRQFRPALFEIESGETFATIAWTPSLFATQGEVEYRIELSRSTDFTDVEYSSTTKDPLVTVLDTEIEIQQDYYARVKAIGMNGIDDSRWLVSEPFQITGEIFILPISESEVLIDQALLHWMPEDVITHVIATPRGGTPVEMEVTSEEAETGEKLLTGLMQDTEYTVVIYKGEVPKGTVRFKTKPSWENDHVIDLTEITGKPNILADTLPDIPAGSVILLKRGERYDISSYDFDKSLTFASAAANVAEYATIEISSNFNIVAAANIDSLVFRDVNLTGLDFNGDYVMNISREGSIGTVRFDNVRGHRFRGWFRIQTGGAGAHVQDFIVNNCVIDSLREYALAWTNNSNSIANIRITNSTVYKARRVISHSSAGSNSIVIENCTFNEAPSGGPEGAEPNYFIDLASNDSNSPIVIRNTIIGRGWNEGGGDYIRGIRAGTSTAVAPPDNSYTTSDQLSNPDFQIGGLTGYSASSTSLFVDPQNGDFRIKDQGFPGANSSGDPRWRN
jgi:hypothetical protein